MLFVSDARDVHLSAEVYQIHDVATALKRFFRSLSDPVLTREHHNEWVSIAGRTHRLVTTLPQPSNDTTVNYTLPWFSDKSSLYNCSF